MELHSAVPGKMASWTMIVLFRWDSEVQDGVMVTLAGVVTRAGEWSRQEIDRELLICARLNFEHSYLLWIILILPYQFPGSRLRSVGTGHWRV